MSSNIVPSGFPKPHIVEPKSPHSNTVIFLHGRDGDGEELAEALSGVGLSNAGAEGLFAHLPSVRWVFPTAKESHSTVFQEELREWFDIYSLADPSDREELQVEGLRNSVTHLRGVVDEEVKRLDGDASRVLLAGISQGEATALVLFLAGGYGFGGFMGFSGWMPLAEQVEGAISECQAERAGSRAEAVSLLLTKSFCLGEIPKGDSAPKSPIFLGHGKDDAYVDVNLGRQVRDILSSMGFNVDWHEYDGADDEGHWLKEPEEFNDIASFIAKAIVANSQK